MLVALDLTAAFDNVDHQQLLDCVFNTKTYSAIRGWPYNYLLNRRANVHLRQKESKSRKVKTGVVQGGVLSPALINYYRADFPIPHPNVKQNKYADDITIYTSGPVITDLINGLNIYLSHVFNNSKKKKPHEHHLHPQVKLAEQVLPLEKKPNVLGMILDTTGTDLLYLGLRQRNFANDLQGNWPLNAQLLLLCLDAITYGH